MESGAKGKKDDGQAMTRIDKTQHKKLKDLSKKFDLTQTDFLNYAVDYFSKTGINPSEKIFSPREEIAKLEKRLTQVIQFWRAFERDNAKPVFDELTKLYLVLKQVVPIISTQADWKNWHGIFKQFIDSQRKRNEKFESDLKEVKMQLEAVQAEQSHQSEKLDLILKYLAGNRNTRKRIEAEYK